MRAASKKAPRPSAPDRTHASARHNVPNRPASSTAHLTLWLLIVCVSLLPSLLRAQQPPPPVEWQNTYGGTANDILYSIATTTDGGYLIAGRSTSLPGATKTSPHYGNYDYWIARLSPSGTQLWDRTFGGSNFDELQEVKQTADGGFILAGYSLSGIDGNKTAPGIGDYWVVRIDPDGNTLWEETYGGSGAETLHGIEETAEGNFLLAGYSDSPVSGGKTSPSLGQNDFWAVLIDANGAILWDKTFGTPAQDQMYSAIQTADGGFLLGGTSAGGPGGTKTSPNHGGNDFWVVRVDPNGNPLWETSYGGGQADSLLSIAPAPDNGFMLGGYTGSPISGTKTSSGHGSTDCWIVRIDSNGNPLWDRTFGGNGDDSWGTSFSLIATADGGYVFGTGTSGDSAGGTKNSLSHGGPDFWVSKIDNTGARLWDQSFGASDTDVLNSLQQTPDGGYILAGPSYSGVGGNKSAPRRGGADYWLIKLAPGRALDDPPVEFYAAPNGNAGNEGSKARPWDLQTAIGGNSPVLPGDIIWLRGGIYNGNFISNLRGRSNQVITVAGFHHEQVTLDGHPNPGAFPLEILGEWVHYKNFEVTQSSTWTGGTPTPVGIQCTAPNVKIINVVVHDAGQGIGFWPGAVNSEIHGCILYHNGHDGQEHGLYTQNDIGTKLIHDNIIFNNSGFGVHAFTQAAQIRGFDFQGNISFNNGSKFGPDRKPNLFLGGFPPSDRINALHNHAYTTPNFSHFNVLLSDRDHSSNPSGTLHFASNYVTGGTGFTADSFQQLTFTGNRIVTSAGYSTRANAPPGFPLSSYSWDHNLYFGPSPGALLFEDGTTRHSFTSWQATSGHDANSTYTTGTPSTTEVIIRPNAYEPGRAHVIVYNWEHLPSVPLDLSNLGFAQGDPYEIRNVQNYIVNAPNSYGTPVESGSFDPDNPVIQLRLNTPEALAVADPGLPGGHIPSTTLPDFGVFVVTPPSDGVPVIVPLPDSHWAFDGNSPGTAVDSFGTNDGTLVNGPLRTEGRINGALTFDGLNDYVTIPDSNTLDLGPSLTISLWLNPTEQLNELSPRQDLLQKLTSYWLILNFPWGDGKLAFLLNDGSRYVKTTTSVWEPGRWYHIVLTYDGASLRIYVDGRLEGTSPATGSPFNTGSPLQFGGNPVDGKYYKGSLDDIRLYHSPLTGSEVFNLFTTTGRTNTPPAISPFDNQTTPEDTPTPTIPFLVTDPESPADHLQVTARSSNPALIPTANIDITGLGSNRNLVITPAPNRNGTCTIIVTVSDDDAVETSTSFTLDVTSINDPPTLSPIPPITLISGFGPRETTVTITDPESSAPAITVTAASSLPSLVPHTNITISGTADFKTIRITPLPGQTGTATLTITATDEDGLAAATSFLVTVTGVNNLPVISTLQDASIQEDQSSPLIPFTIDDDETARDDLLVFATSSNPALVPPSGIELGGLGPSRTIRLTPPTNQWGSTIITLTVVDEHNGTNQTPFLFTVSPVNDPPAISSILNQVIDQNSSTGSLPFTLSDPDNPAATLIVTVNSSNPLLLPITNIVLLGDSFLRTLNATPATNQFGSSIITITASDGAATGTRSFTVLVRENVVIATNLISHWRFDESSGNTALDVTQRNPGTLVNNPAHANGRIGRALTFDGASSHVNIPHNDSLNLGNNFTISLWFKPSLLLNAQTGRRDLFKKFLSYWLIMNYPSGDGRIAFVLNSGAPAIHTTTTQWSPDNWYHLAASCNATTLRLYINGTLETSAPIAASATPSAYPLQIGGNTEQGYFFPGSIDDVRLYNTALPGSQINTLYTDTLVPNSNPTLTGLTSRTIDEDAAAETIAFMVGDAESPPASLEVSATSSNPTLVPSLNISLTGGDAFRFISLTPAPNQAGTATITVTVTDPDGAARSQELTLTVNPINDPPTLSIISGQSTNEDTPDGPVPFTIGDPETPAADLMITVLSSNPTLLPDHRITLGGTHGSRTLTLNPLPNASGIATITLIVSDTGGASVTNDFDLTVHPVNDNPTVSLINPQSVQQDSTTAPIPFTIDDPESPADSLTLLATSSNPALLPNDAIILSGTGNNHSLTATPLPGQIGTTTITITVTDPGDGSGTRSFLLTVTIINDPPAASTIDPQAINEDTSTPDLPFTLSDDHTAPGNLLLQAFSSNPVLVPGSNILLGGTGSNRTATILPATNQTGTATISIVIQDEHDGFLTNSFLLTVNPVNDAPTISALQDITLSQGSQSGPIGFLVHDLESDAASLSVSGSSSNQILLPDSAIVIDGTGTNRTLLLTPEPGGIGTATIAITVSDSLESRTETFLLTVVATNVFPTINPVPALSGTEDNPATVVLEVSDHETAPASLIVTVSSDNPALLPDNNISLTGEGAALMASLTPLPDQSGSTTLTVTVADEEGATTSISFVFTVQPVNDPPTLGTIPGQITRKGQPTASLPFTVGDIESAGTSLAVSALSSDPLLLPPEGITLGGTDTLRTIRLTPAPNQSGPVTVTVSVTDGELSVSNSFLLLIEDVAPPPEGIVGHWKLDEETGSTAVDAINGNNGALLNGPAWNAGIFGNALLFDGVNDVVVIPGQAALDLDQTMSISIWFKPSHRIDNVTPRANLMNKFFSYWMDFNWPYRDGKLSFLVGSGSPWISTTTTVWNAEQWYHAAATYNGSVISIYINGRLEDSKGAAGAPYQTTSPVELGGFSRFGFHFPGAIDEFQLYDRALSASEVLGIFNNSTQPNTPPTLSNIDSQITPEDTPTTPIPFIIGDSDTPANSLTVTASSSNPALIPGQNLVLGGTGASRSLIATPLPNQSGISTITLTVTDGASASTSNSFELAVTAVNDPPTLSDILDQTLQQDSSSPPIPFSIGDPETTPGNLVLTATSSDTNILAPGGIRFEGNTHNRTLTLTPNPGRIGPVIVTITVTDADGASASDLFSLLVTRINIPPGISSIPDQTIAEDTPTAALALVVSDPETPPENLTLQAASSNPGLIPAANVLIAGIGTNRTVTLTPLPNQSGTAIINLTVTDQDNGSGNSSFTVFVDPVNDGPTLGPIAHQTLPAGRTTPPNPIIVDDIDTPAASLTLSALSSNPAIAMTGDITFGGTGTARTVQVATAPGQIGSTLITVIVGDGFLSATNTFTITTTEAPPVVEGLIAHWKLDEPDGTTAFDSAGTHHGTLLNNPQRAAGQIDGSLAFNITSSHQVVNIPDHDLLDLDPGMSISLWFKPDQLLNNQSPRSDLLKKFLSYWIIMNFPYRDGKMSFVLNSGSPLVRTTTITWEPGQWYHLVGTYDGAVMKIFINGQLNNSNQAAGPVANSTYPVQIGGNTEQEIYFKGGLDDIRLYSRAITATEVSTLHANGNPTPIVAASVNLDDRGVYICLNGPEIQLNWTAQPGQSFRVQYKDDLADPGWQELTNIVTALDFAPFVLLPAHASPQRFYRIVEAP